MSTTPTSLCPEADVHFLALFVDGHRFRFVSGKRNFPDQFKRLSVNDAEHMVFADSSPPLAT